MQKRKIIKGVAKTVLAFTLASAMTSGVVGCGGGDNRPKTPTGPITVVWYPNESAGDYAEVRKQFSDIIEKAVGRKVEHKLTTDYNITIEAIASGAADIAAVMGAVGYIAARDKNPNVDILFVNSGASGTLDDAVYYSWLCVNKNDADKYRDGDGYSITNIQGKSISFVSNSSASGFKIPTSAIINFFKKTERWKNISEDDMVEGGQNAFFKNVLFGGSHQGSAVNLLTRKADVASFCDQQLTSYVNLTEGTMNKVGAVYTVKKDAPAPFTGYADREFVSILSVPVLNGPFAYNPKNLTAEEIKKIRDAMTSDEVAANPYFFGQKDAGHSYLFPRVNNDRFVLADDSWYNPIRELGN